MSTLEEYSTDKCIREMLCRLRVKLAQQRNKSHLIHLHSADPKYNYHEKKLRETDKLLCSMFPPRKLWKTLGEVKRKKDGIPRNTSEKNMLILLSTIAFYEKNEPSHPFLVSLNSFISDIQNSIHNSKYKIKSPTIIPKLKADKLCEIGLNFCRPIASFCLKDKIILSIINKYLTEVFDKCFIDESFAFRYKRLINGVCMSPTHHDPVQEIITYRERLKEENLFVAECDMKNFFDTVNHSIIKKTFKQLSEGHTIKVDSQIEFKNAKRILYDYLDSYTFNKNVLPLNDKQEYFDEYNIKKGEFKWVKEELISNNYYKKLSNAKIGIPQGGALSGLIANMVLNGVDKKVLKHQDNSHSLLYVRFCDDMLIMHPDQKICEKAFNEYLNGLKLKKLVVHKPELPPFLSPNNFWKHKSKGCYKWDDNAEAGSPWIGFVGYEIHHKGYLRVRKSSLLKEMRKQYEVVNELKEILNNRVHCRSANNTIYESAANRLIGMSVGRVTLWNYKAIRNTMCWTSGYKLLTDNKYLRIQLKRLDTSRSRMLLKLKKKAKKMQDEKVEVDKVNQSNVKAQEQIFYGAPFSYYYQTLKPWLEK